jgi:RHS repeat-associated protein
LWDEENRLLALSDNGFVSNYWYDAAGDRTVKESGNGEGVQVNGLLSGARTGMTNFTAYISPYLVLNNGGYYTKHIYLGSQRIVSKLGSSDIFSASPLTAVKAYSKDFTAKYADLTGKIKTRYDSLGVTYRGIDNAGAGMITSIAGRIPTPLQYFYHSDHLGSSSLITNASGTLVQHLEYIPFGEVFIDERPTTSSWSTPYKFNAKELDEETGLYYYGARYYDPRTSVWISADKMAEKYPNFSSYVYCKQNPINRTDPDGNTDRFNRSGGYINSTIDGKHDIVILDGGHEKPFSSIQTHGFFNYDERRAAENIIGFYAKKAGINEDIDVHSGIEEGTDAAFSPFWGDINFYSQNSGGLIPSLNNYCNLFSVLEHEHFHKTQGETKNYSDHAKVYLLQMTRGKFFKFTDQRFKNSTMIQFIARLEIAKSKGESKYKELITEFNKTNSQGYTINDRDSGSMQLLDKKGGDVTPPQIMKVITEIHKPQD